MRRGARLLAAALLATLAIAGVATPADAGSSHAVVVVDTGGSVITREISFSGSISGYQALVLAGANPVVDSYGGSLGNAICSLFGAGNDADHCLDSPSWAYFRSPGDSTSWSFSLSGASNTRVNHGDVEGWRLGGGSPRVSVCSVKDCGPPPAADPPPPAAAVGGPTSDPSAPSAPGAAGSAGAPGGSGAPGSAAATADGAGEPAADGTTGTTAAPTATTRPEAATRRDGASGGDERALAAPRITDDGGSGSPVGVIAALLVVAAIGGAAVVLRRRGRQPG